MKIDILTIFPEMFEGFLKTSIIKRAIEKNIVKTNIKKSMTIHTEEAEEWS